MSDDVAFGSYHSCRKVVISESTLFLSVSRFLCRIPLSLILISMTFRMKFEINPNLPVGCTGWLSRFVLGVKGYYSYRVVLFQGLGAYPWGGKFEDKLSIVRWH